MDRLEFGVLGEIPVPTPPVHPHQGPSVAHSSAKIKFFTADSSSENFANPTSSSREAATTSRTAPMGRPASKEVRLQTQREWYHLPLLLMAAHRRRQLNQLLQSKAHRYFQSWLRNLPIAKHLCHRQRLN